MKGTFQEGYRDGWEGVAGDEPLPADPTHPPERERADYEIGYEYGRADALEWKIPKGS